MMKSALKLLPSALLGFVSVLLLLNLDYINFADYAFASVVVLLAIGIALLAVSLLLYRQIKKLDQIQFKGDAEDEADIKKYKKFTDYSLLVQISLTLFILALCIAIVSSQNYVLAIVAGVFIMISYLFSAFMIQLMQSVYPERNLPNASDPKLSEKLLLLSDEGERHVMLTGLHKAYSMVTGALVIAIAAATVYSVVSEHSQIFSIIAMCVVLMLVNGTYSLSIRNK